MESLYKKFKIIEKKQETKNVFYFTFDSALKAKPGQFVMVWLPELEEKPFSIASDSPFELAIAQVGKTSASLCSKNIGEEIFLRGPYGKGYKMIGKKWLVVGGGYGFAPLRFLIKEGVKKGVDIDCVIGAKSKEYLMEAPKEKNIKTIFTTDDGSYGLKGTVVVALKQLLEKKDYDCIYSCGPEKMLKAVALLASENSIPSQISVERYYKCGFGICGHCSLNGWLS
ncbi:MAG: dihydroorotate dehydrogenase electron transfer subunit, partial [Candidatus Anstonellaceae archaeon]